MCSSFSCSVIPLLEQDLTLILPIARASSSEIFGAHSLVEYEAIAEQPLPTQNLFDVQRGDGGVISSGFSPECISLCVVVSESTLKCLDVFYRYTKTSPLTEAARLNLADEPRPLWTAGNQKLENLDKLGLEIQEFLKSTPAKNARADLFKF